MLNDQASIVNQPQRKSEKIYILRSSYRIGKIHFIRICLRIKLPLRNFDFSWE